MNLLQKVNEWVQKGFDVRYFITDQIENGYQAEVEAGNMPRYTYSFFIDENEEMVWDYSVNTLEDGFTKAIDWLKENR